MLMIITTDNNKVFFSNFCIPLILRISKNGVNTSKNLDYLCAVTDNKSKAILTMIKRSR